VGRRRIEPPSQPGRPSSPYASRILPSNAFVDELASARIGETFNQYRGSQLRRERLIAYLERRSHARFLLVGEAPGYRGARISGIPFTSERQLTGSGPSEATATLVQRILAELGLAESVLLWNVVPTHPGTATSNRTPTRAEIAAGLPFVRELGQGRRVVAVGRLAQAALGGLHVRHPSHGGAQGFRDGLIELLDHGHLARDPA
jgi:uracil-DNA glycosylase family 4